MNLQVHLLHFVLLAVTVVVAVQVQRNATTAHIVWQEALHQLHVPQDIIAVLEPLHQQHVQLEHIQTLLEQDYRVHVNHVQVDSIVHRQARLQLHVHQATFVQNLAVYQLHV